MTLQTSPALSGLARLADRTGLDVRPTLLRVLTDLYVLKPAHTDEEERHYVELAMRLLDGVDVASRVAAAERLSKFPGAPRPIIQRLARDVLDVASIVLKTSRTLDRAELVSIAEECGSAYATIVAERPDIQALLNGETEELPVTNEAAPAAIPAVAPTDIPLAPQESGPRQVEPEPVRPLSAERSSRLSALFLSSEAADRRMILINLEYSPIPPAESVTATRVRDAIRKLEHAALSRQPRSFARVLSECLGLSIRLTQDLIDDPAGEPLIVLAKAIGMSSDVLQRVLLFLNPSIGESVRQVYDLATLYDEVSRESALRLVAIWKASDTRQLARHETSLWDDEIARARVSATPQARAAIVAGAQAQPRRFHGGQAVRS